MVGIKKLLNNYKGSIGSWAMQIANGGWGILLLKIYQIILMPIALPVVLVIRLVSPVVLIRYGALCSHRIGHFAVNTELYLCKRDLTETNKNVYDIFFHVEPISNWQLKKMWDRSQHVSTFPYFMRAVKSVNRLFPGHQKYEIDLSKSRDVGCLFMRVPPHINFTKEEEVFGREQLRKLGIDDDSSFICFHARDPVYLDTLFTSADWRYHDYRNCSINNYIAAAEELSQRGYFLIRMGSKVKEPLKVNNERIIDYAVKYRNDFLDIYLSAKCRFFLGCGSGIDEIANIFRRPVVYVNFIPFERVYSWKQDHIFIPKKLWLRKEKRFLTFREILGSGMGRCLFGEQFEAAGIEVIENTSEEIKAVAVEMDERLNGTWKETSEDIELQNRFWSLFKPSDLHGSNMVARIGAEFLRQNKELLE